MEILWAQSSPLSVSEVLEVLHARKPVAYTTVMTVLEKMVQKHSAKRFKKGKAYFYSPQVKRPEVLSCLVREFTSQYFGGQCEKLTRFVNKKSSERRNNKETYSTVTEETNAESMSPEPEHSPIDRPKNAPAEIDTYLL